MVSTQNLKTIGMTPRHGFVSRWQDPTHPEVFIDLDFRNQELYIAGVLSQDKTFLRALLEEPEYKTIEIDGKEVTYPNPAADLHTLTTKDCCFPEFFIGVPEHKIVATAKDEALIKQKGAPRDYGKVTNFGIAYFQTAKAMADLNYLPEEECAQWIERHEATYVQFHSWAKQEKELAAARGWVANDWSGRIRWVQEENSKAAGASPGRSGVNFKIQSLGADIGKLALVKLLKESLRTPIKIQRFRIRAFIHDEVLITAPGRCWLDEAATEKASAKAGAWTPKWAYDDQARETAERCKQLMEEAESEVLGGYPGMASYSIGPYWVH
jgi:hypothetical protein